MKVLSKTKRAISEVRLGNTGSRTSNIPRWVIGKKIYSQFTHRIYHDKSLVKSWLNIIDKLDESPKESYYNISNQIELSPSEETELFHSYEDVVKYWKTWTYKTSSFPKKRSPRRLYKNNVARISNVLSSKPVSEREILQNFQEYACRIITKMDIELVSTSIKDWISAEDSSWKQLIVDFKVEAKPETALELWDNLSDELSSFISNQYKEESSELNKLLAVTVRW